MHGPIFDWPTPSSALQDALILGYKFCWTPYRADFSYACIITLQTKKPNECCNLKVVALWSYLTFQGSCFPFPLGKQYSDLVVFLEDIRRFWPVQLNVVLWNQALCHLDYACHHQGHQHLSQRYICCFCTLALILIREENSNPNPACVICTYTSFTATTIDCSKFWCKKMLSPMFLLAVHNKIGKLIIWTLTLTNE